MLYLPWTIVTGVIIICTNWTPIYTQHGINESGPSVANPTYHQAMRQIVAQRPQRPQLCAATVATRGAASQQQCLGSISWLSNLENYKHKPWLLIGVLPPKIGLSGAPGAVGLFCNPRFTLLMNIDEQMNTNGHGCFWRNQHDDGFVTGGCIPKTRNVHGIWRPILRRRKSMILIGEICVLYLGHQSLPFSAPKML